MTASHEEQARTAPSLAIILAAKNSRAAVHRTLASVVACDLPLEIVVADCGSTDGTVLMLRRAFPSVRLRPVTGLEPGHAINHAVIAATAPRVLVVEPGTLITKDGLAAEGDGRALPRPEAEQCARRCLRDGCAFDPAHIPTGETPFRLPPPDKAPGWKAACPWQPYVRTNGAAAFFSPTLRDRLRLCDCAARFEAFRSPWPEYQEFLATDVFLTCADIAERKERVDEAMYRPVISVLVPVFRPPLEELRACLLSLETQIYPYWEACLIDDGGGRADIRAELTAFRDRHPDRCRLVLRDDNRGIARTSQEALELATGEYAAILDHDDTLQPDALFEVAQALDAAPEADWLYSDEDKTAPDGTRHFYHFKPDWSPTLLLGGNYALHLSVFRRELALDIGGFRDAFEGSQDYDLFLRLAEATDRIVHIPRILYSWRQSHASTSASHEHKQYVYEAGIKALDAALARRGLKGKAIHAEAAWRGIYRVEFPSSHEPLAILCLGGEAESSATLRAWSADAASAAIVTTGTLTCGESPAQALSRFTGETTAPFLLCVMPGCEPETSDAVRTLLGLLSDSGVAAASPKIVLPDGTVDCCGMVLGTDGRLLPLLHGIDAHAAASGAYGAIPREVGAMGPQAILFRTDALRTVLGEIPSAAAPWSLALILSLALRQRGWRLLADGGVCARTPLPSPIDPDALPGGDGFCIAARTHPGLLFGGDPYFNMNLSESSLDFGVLNPHDLLEQSACHNMP